MRETGASGQNAASAPLHLTRLPHYADSETFSQQNGNPELPCDSLRVMGKSGVSADTVARDEGADYASSGDGEQASNTVGTAVAKGALTGSSFVGPWLLVI